MASRTMGSRSLEILLAACCIALPACSGGSTDEEDGDPGCELPCGYDCCTAAETCNDDQCVPLDVPDGDVPDGGDDAAVDSGTDAAPPCGMTYALPPVPDNTYAGWRTRAEKEELWTAMWNLHGLSSRVVSIGLSEQGRDIWLFECGHPSGPVIMFDAELHGNEDHPNEVLLMLADWLLNSCESEAETILASYRLVFVPIVDTDMSNQQGADFQRWNANHVNLNRNFATGWSTWGTNDPTSDDYYGPSAASESETQAVRHAFETFQPRVYVNMHVGAFQAVGMGNGTLGNAIKDSAPSFTSYFGATAHSGGAAGGTAPADAITLCPGVSAWLLEIFGTNDASPHGNGWKHTSWHLDQLQNEYYPRIKEFLSAAAAQLGA